MSGFRQFTTLGGSRKSRRRTLRMESLSSRQLLAADLGVAFPDVSGDGILSPLDVLQVSNAVSQGVTATEQPRFDVNLDQVIDARDVEATLAALVAVLRERDLRNLETGGLPELDVAIMAADDAGDANDPLMRAVGMLGIGSPTADASTSSPTERTGIRLDSTCAAMELSIASLQMYLTSLQTETALLQDPIAIQQHQTLIVSVENALAEALANYLAACGGDSDEFTDLLDTIDPALTGTEPEFTDATGDLPSATPAPGTDLTTPTFDDPSGSPGSPSDQESWVPSEDPETVSPGMDNPPDDIIPPGDSETDSPQNPSDPSIPEPTDSGLPNGAPPSEPESDIDEPTGTSPTDPAPPVDSDPPATEPPYTPWTDDPSAWVPIPPGDHPNYDEPITAEIRIDFAYDPDAPLSYSDANLVAGPDEDLIYTYQTHIPFVVEVTASVPAHGGDFYLVLYVSHDGLERPFGNAPIPLHLYDGNDFYHVVIPSGVAREVGLRAELYYTQTSLVQAPGENEAPQRLGEAKKTETIGSKIFGPTSKIPEYVLDAAERYTRERAAKRVAGEILDYFVPRESEIANLMAQGGFGYGYASTLFDQKYEALLPLIQAPLDPFFSEAADAMFGEKLPQGRFNFGEAGPDKEKLLDLGDKIEAAMRRGADLLTDVIDRYVKVEFESPSLIFDQITGQTFRNFIAEGDFHRLRRELTLDSFLAAQFIKKLKFSMPVPTEHENIKAAIFITANKISASGIKGSTVGAELKFNFRVNNRNFQGEFNAATELRDPTAQQHSFGAWLEIFGR